MRFDPLTRSKVARVFSGSGDHRLRLVARSPADERAVIDEIVAGRDQVVVVRLDSDDMLHPAVIGEIRARASEPGWEWGFWRHGYAVAYSTGTVFAYDTRHVGPFFAHRYERADVFARRGTFSEPRHRDVGDFDPIDLGRGRFVVGLTGVNTETSMASRSVGPRLPEPEAADIRAAFSIELRPGWHRVMSMVTGG